MRVIGSVSSNLIVGTNPDPEVGDVTTVNGQFVVPTPPGVGLSLTSTSYLTPQDAGSVPGLMAAQFLSRNPAFDFAFANFFIEAADIALLDLAPAAPSPTSANVVSGTLPTSTFGPNGPRCVVGRGVGPAPLGNSPNSVTLLARNSARVTPTYGSIVTETIDLIPFTGAGGTDEVLIWWKVATLSTSQDVVHGYNVTAGTNEPALRTLTELDDTAVVMPVYVSVDDGVTWDEVTRLVPTELTAAGTDLRIAFLNQGTTPITLLSYVILVKTA